MSNLEDTVERVVVHFNTGDSVLWEDAKKLLDSTGSTYGPLFQGFDWNAEELVERRPARTYLIEVPTRLAAERLAGVLLRDEYTTLISDAYWDPTNITIQG